MDDDKLTEILARMWIECDPNRGGGEPGSGFHPDDPETLHDSDGKPYPAQRWQWFIPRAKATMKFLDERGLKIVEIEP